MQPFLYEVDGIHYSVCEERDVPDMVHVLAETFTRDDPPAVAVGLTADEFEVFVRLVSRSAGSDGLTIVARDVASGVMAGALLTEDAVTPLPDGMDRLSDRFAAIFDLFGQLDDQVHDEGSIAQGEVLHLFLLGVADPFTRRGIGQHLVTACLANGAERGYRAAVTEATNRVSQHVFGKLGFVSRGQVSYADFRHESNAVFASIAEHDGPMSMSRDISVVD